MLNQTVENILQQIIKSPQMMEGIAWQRRTYQANEIVVKAGDQGDKLYWIEKGGLRVLGHVQLESHKHIQPGISDLKAGMLFGESCLQTVLPRTATVMAVTESVLLEIKGQRLSIYLDDHPIHGYLFYKSLFEIMIHRLSRTNHTVETLLKWGLEAHEIDQYL